MKNKQLRYDRLYLDIAWRVSQMSYAERLKVGAIVVKDGSIISHGWNGMPTGMDNCCEYLVDGELRTRPEVIHAEENALDKITRSTVSAVGAILYMTHNPCMHCAKQVANSGVVSVIYEENYRLDEGVSYLRDRGLKVYKWSDLCLTER